MPKNKKIDWMIIGGSKCGSSALHTIMKQHPQIEPSKIKELQFFHSPDRYRWGLDSYIRNWEHLDDPDIKCGESTPGYSYYTECPKKIYQYNPDIKMILLLRDPLEKVISGYYYSPAARHITFESLWALPIIDCANHDIARRMPGGLNNIKVSRGIYAPQIERYLRFFPREQFLFLKHDEFVQNHQNILNQTTDFLEVPRFEFENKKVNVTNYKNRHPISDKIRKVIRDLYVPDLAKTEELTGLNLEKWKKRLTSI